MPAPAQQPTARGGGYALLVLAFVFLGGGLGIGLPRVFEAWEDRQIVSDGARVTGVISDVDFTSRRARLTAIKTVTFTAGGATEYTAEGRERVNERRDGPRDAIAENLLGDRVTVFHDPTDPRRNVVEDHEASLAAPLFLVVFLGGAGSVLAFIGVAGLLHNLRHPGPEQSGTAAAEPQPG